MIKASPIPEQKMILRSSQQDKNIFSQMQAPLTKAPHSQQSAHQKYSQQTLMKPKSQSPVK
jgi:hypothetical protein